MKKLLSYHPLHFLVFLIIGITIQYYTEFWNYGFQYLGITIIVILLSLFVLRVFKLAILFTFLSFILWIFIGITTIYIQDDINYSDYYKHSQKENVTYIVKVIEILKTGSYYDKYKVKVIEVGGEKSRGKILLNILKDSLQQKLQVDNILMLKPELNELKSPLNQHQFNYKSYLAKQGIHHQIFVTKNEFISIVNSDVSLFGLSSKFRERVKESLQKYHFSKNEFGVINALLLGQRQDISKELINDYANAGAIHILAVSGLHIGIILLILSSILKPLERIKYGKFIKLLLIVMLLWVFAFIAGLSASVVRAVTMFTFVAFGMISNRKSNIYYSLITSMFYLLLIKSMFLFDVGFQLSYLAVFGIVWIQPMLSSLWIPKYKLINKIWQLLTVSVAAQLIILPVSLYYFHQFPSLFLLSNLVIIPFLGIILMLGILVIVLAVINLLPQILADFYGTVINMMNQFVSWVASQEGFLLIDISVSKLVMISLYIAIFSGVYFFNKRTSKGLLVFLVSLTLIQSTFIYEKYIRNSKHELIIFHKSRTSIIGERNAGKLLVSSELDTVEIRNLKLLKSYKIGEDIDLTFKNKIQDVFYTNKNQLLVIDSLGVYQNLNINQPIVLLRHSPKINLKRMINELNPKQIIADGNNYKSYINNWREICEKEKVPFHYTGKNGTYIIK